MKPSPRRTTADLPVHELSPEEFHLMVLHLLDSREGYEEVENHGLLGDDRGIDIIALHRSFGQSDGEVERVLIQVKRAKSFDKSDAIREVDRLNTTGAGHFDRYVLVVSGSVSSAAYREMRERLPSKGINDFEVWDRAILTVKLTNRPRIVEHFFGVPDDLDDDFFRSFIKLAQQGHPVVCVVGSSESGFNPILPQSDWTVPLSALIQRRVVRSVVTLMPMLDLTTMLISWGTNHSGIVFETSLESLSNSLGGLLQEDWGTSPLLLGLSLAPSEEEALASIAARFNLGESMMVSTSNFTAVENGGGSYSPYELLTRLHSELANDWLIHHLERLDFSKPMIKTAVIQGDQPTPGIVHIGHRSPRIDDQRDSMETIGVSFIDGPSGTGKTVDALFVAFETCESTAYRIDLAVLPPVSVGSIARLVQFMERDSLESVLIVDNAQLCISSVEPLSSALRERRFPKCGVILVQTSKFEKTDFFGGQSKEPTSDPWKAKRRELASWAEGHETPSRIKEAANTAQNEWHFMFVLRGGSVGLESELRSVESSGGAATIWFAVSALMVFRRTIPSPKQVFLFLDEFDLWPIPVLDSERVQWFEESLLYLIANRFLLFEPDVVQCRHPIEARAIIFSLFSMSSSARCGYDEATRKLLSETLGDPILTPQRYSDSDGLAKGDIYQFADGIVEPLIELQIEIEAAIPYDEEIQSAVDRVWSPLIRLIENWRPHYIYWLFNRIHFSGYLPRFDPFSQMVYLNALENIRNASDAIDLTYFVDGVLGVESIYTRCRMQIHAWAAEDAFERLSLDEYEKRVDPTKSLGEFRASLGVSDAGESSKKRKGLASAHSRRVDDVLVSLYGVEVERIKNARRKMEILAQDGRRELIELGGPIDGMVPLPARLYEQPRRDVEIAEQLVGVLSIRNEIAKRRRIYKRVFEKISVKTVVEGLANIGSTRPMLLAHIFLISPEFGGKILSRSPISWHEEIIDALNDNLDYLSFHLEPLYVLPTVIRNMAMASPIIDRWIRNSVQFHQVASHAWLADIPGPAGDGDWGFEDLVAEIRSRYQLENPSGDDFVTSRNP
jgi:Restriction endonuclease